MLDFEAARFKRSLAETVAWCAMQTLVANPADSGASRNRRALYEQSEQQMQKARASAKYWFRRKVTDTKQWHQAMVLLKQVRDSLGPLEDRLRSAALKPGLELNAFETNAPWAEAVAEVVNRRSALVSRTSPEEDLAISMNGRLLLYYPHENLMDGAAESFSNGFFDENNVPPWDIWVDFSEDTLVSWVPSVLIEAAQMGIDVKPEACIRWAA